MAGFAVFLFFTSRSNETERQYFTRIRTILIIVTIS
jgi:hypothetical protein